MSDTNSVTEGDTLGIEKAHSQEILASVFKSFEASFPHSL